MLIIKIKFFQTNNFVHIHLWIMKPLKTRYTSPSCPGQQLYGVQLNNQKVRTPGPYTKRFERFFQNTICILCAFDR